MTIENTAAYVRLQHIVTCLLMVPHFCQSYETF